MQVRRTASAEIDIGFTRCKHRFHTNMNARAGFMRESDTRAEDRSGSSLPTAIGSSFP
jgi:hypothetical protein